MAGQDGVFDALKKCGSLTQIQRVEIFTGFRAENGEDEVTIHIFDAGSRAEPAARYMCVAGKRGVEEIRGDRASSVEEAISNCPWENLDG